MAFRVILVENEVNIRIKLDNLIINNGEKDIWAPIDDISIIVLDNLKINLTARMLCVLANHNVGLVLCNQEHLPIGYYSSYDNYSRISKNIGFQINQTNEFYNNLWAEIIRHKIENQAQVLQKLLLDSDIIEHLYQFAFEVKPGDPDNREAHAAKIYFNELMGTSFSRGNEDILINSGLDYGYAIIRSYLARLCVGYGLNTQLGIHHRSEYNRFNLVDDLIEPIRPIVDIYVYRLLEYEDYFKPEHRRKLINLLNHKILYKNKKMFMCNMMEEYVSSVAAYLAGKKMDIEYPTVNDYLGEKGEV